MRTLTSTSGSSQSVTTISQAAERYEFKTLITNGRMGSIYEATERHTGEAVTLKLLALNLPSRADRRKFNNMAKKLIAINHSGIVPVRDYGHHYGLAFLASDDVPGITIREFLTVNGSMSWRTFAPIFLGIMKALAIAHDKGLLHGDVQATQIILQDDGRHITNVSLTGFGFPDLSNNSISEGADTRHVSVVDGIAPERLLKQIVDHRLDLYAAGALAYEMLSGKQPFQGSSMQRVFSALYEPAEPLRSLLGRGSDVPEAALMLIDQLLEKSPSDRPQDASEVIRRLMSIGGGPLELKDAGVKAITASDRRTRVSVEDIAAARPRFGAGQSVPTVQVETSMVPVGVSAPVQGQGWLPSPQLVVQVSLLLFGFSVFVGAGWLAVMQLAPHEKGSKDPITTVVEMVPKDAIERPDSDVHALFDRIASALEAREFGKAEDMILQLESRRDFPSDLSGTLEAYRARLDLNSGLERARRLEDSDRGEDALLIYSELAKRYPRHARVPTAVDTLKDSFVLEVNANVRSVVLIDEEPVGVTPFISVVPITTREVSVSRKGYRDWTRSVAAQEGGRLTLDADLQKRRKGDKLKRRKLNPDASPFMDLMEMQIK